MDVEMDYGLSLLGGSMLHQLSNTIVYIQWSAAEKITASLWQSQWCVARATAEEITLKSNKSVSLPVPAHRGSPH